MSKRRKKLEAKIGIFLKHYTRKQCTVFNSNDRHYDREIEREIKLLSPEELNELLNGNIVDSN